MAITTLDGLIAAAKRELPLYKTAARTTVAGGWFSMTELAGNPGAGVLAGASTTTGVVPTDATAGHPVIPFTGGRTHLSKLTASSTVVSQIRLFDMLWKGGAYAFNAAVTGQTPTSFASRVAYNGGSANYNGLELWVETVTAATGNQTWNVTYTDQDGNAGATTGAIGIGAAPTVGRCWQLPLASGDSGLQGVTGVAGGTATAGTANILVLRPIMNIYIGVASQMIVLNPMELVLPEIFNDSALFALVMAPSGTSSGLPFLNFQVANG
ncbi:MAG: hypothetical protein ACRC2H_00865 [Silanimonas sp.]